MSQHNLTGIPRMGSHVQVIFRKIIVITIKIIISQ